ncbi:hypothetical protein GCM10023219_29690 [Stakelama sediminis]|uniref:SET domain-containing protein n=1 Tax=Stakelama sediminis TaxID=463200 RepID=A0A840Z3R9_9SPHN|nr:hypothetical protein [Stakelama sediminis]
MAGVGVWFAIAIACHFGAYCAYLLGLRRDMVQPNRASWLIWSFATTVEAVTYVALNPGTPQGMVFLMSAGFCILVTLGLWRQSQWSAPSATELFCIVACLGAIGLWLVFRNTFWAHMLVVAAVPVSFWPTWQSAMEDRTRETSPAWGWWTIGDLATLLVALRASRHDIADLAYIVVEISCHAGVWLMIGLATINPWRSLRRGGMDTGWRFRVGDTHLGKAVFATHRFAEGAILMPFTGRRFHADRVPSLMRGQQDRFVQVGAQEYMGPSGGYDDLVNHSCDPNAGLRFTDKGVLLIALRDIAAGDEITWDYSTTLAENNWHMICQCRSEQCRRVIGNFSTLSPERQEWFRRRNLVAPHLRRRDSVTRIEGDTAAGQ